MTNPTHREHSAFGVPANDQTFPRLGVKRKDPVLDSLMSKLVAGNDQRSNGNYGLSNRPLTAPDIGLLQKISDMSTANVTDAASLVQLLPDLELAVQILISSILSPKDMVTTELNFSVEPGQFKSELAGALLERVRDYFENTYKISELMPDMLKDALFYKGAYPMAILPESSIDDAINSPARVTLESLSDTFAPGTFKPHHLGILGPGSGEAKTTAGLESLINPYRASTTEYTSGITLSCNNHAIDSYIDVVDNPNVLKLPMLQDKLQQDRLQDILSVRKLDMRLKRDQISAEGYGKAEENSLYRRRRYKCQPIVALTPGSHMKRKTEGHPLVMTLPTECVIPVHVPSNPEEHLGYFLLLDEHGNPLTKATESDYYTDMATNVSANKEMVSQLIQTTKRNVEGTGQPAAMARQEEIDQLERIYGELVEKELQARLQNGAYGPNVAVSRPQEIYRIMLARALAKMRTQVVYLPAEMLTYIAFDYNRYGVGVSLLQTSKIIGGMRAMLLFANTMAAVKNSVGRTQLNITLDPNDPDPTTTVEFLMHEYAKTRQGTYPLGASNPLDIISFLQNAAVEVTVSGNAAYPETKLEVEDKQSNRAKPDPELEKSLRDRHLMSMGLSPETVDAGANAEFAASILNNNLLLTKRVLVIQRVFVAFLAEFIQKYTLASGALLDELRDVIRDNHDKLTKDQVRIQERAVDAAEATQGQTRAPVAEAEPENESETQQNEEGLEEVGIDAILFDFIQAIRVSLPSPDTATLDNQMKAFDAYVEALDKAIKAYLDPEFLSGTEMGELQEVLPTTIAAVRSYYIRQWLRNNNVMPELDDLTTFSDEDGPAFNLMEANKSHIEALRKSVAEYMERLLATRKKSDKTFTDAVDAAGGNADDDNADTAAASEIADTDTDAGLDTSASIGEDLGDANFDTDANADAGAAAGTEEGSDASDSSDKADEPDAAGEAGKDSLDFVPPDVDVEV